MPRLRIIILEQDDPQTFRYALWADVPAARQAMYANPSAASVWSGATAQDLANLRSGAMVEHTDKLSVQKGETVLKARTILQANWQGFQDRITAEAKWTRYGTTWDGTTWTVGGVN